MRRRLNRILFLLFLVNSLFAEEKEVSASFNGQISAWGITQLDHGGTSQFGSRFVPTMLAKCSLTEDSKFDMEASLNLHATADFKSLSNIGYWGQLRPYRVWARYVGKNWEIRGGLQKINFGSAKLFRPLMWFDGLDVRDPLQLTDGVYGLLGRYYYPDNANLWLWTLVGNVNKKAWDIMGSAQWKPELGGRFQFPVGTGELAISSHYRKAMVHSALSSVAQTNLLNESKLGLDGKWDLGVGFWFESSMTLLQKNSYGLPRVQDTWNVGADYTFSIGNGLGVTAEYFRYHIGNQLVVGDTGLNLLGTIVSYPVTILDNFSAMVFYLPSSGLTYNYFSWNRTYDNWSIYAIGFLNPNNALLLGSSLQGRNLFVGKGAQLMVNYNF